ncbi:hypothetical protein PSHT_06852 [Puccinia striiformis]|uniref:Uncharacterized protein n=1 Tax=Puccinia striiformis TaxID=27350 RepID=A0A2S4W3B1_9BASI|nr:hypothetical protein PSHT_06852 [Puccinia striiformis]
MRGPDSSLDGPLSLPITRFREGHSPPFRDVLASCLVLSWLSAWVLRRYGWKVGSSLVFGVLIVGLVSLETFLIDGQLWSSKGAPFVRFSPSSSILISSSLRLSTTTLPASSYTLSVMSQQPRPAPYHRRPVPYPPPYERVASHPYGLRPRVTPIRSYGPVPRPTPVRPANNIPAQKTWFCPTRRGVHARDPERSFPFGFGNASCSCSTGSRFHAKSGIQLIPFRWSWGACHVSKHSGSSLFDGKSVWDSSRLGQPFLSPVYNPNARDTPCIHLVQSLTELSDILLPSLFRRTGVWFFRCISPSYSAIVVPPAPRPRNMSTPPSSPRNPPGYVPSPRAATWGQRRRSESSTPGPGPTSARDSSAASVAEHAEIRGLSESSR